MMEASISSSIKKRNGKKPDTHVEAYQRDELATAHGHGGLTKFQSENQTSGRAIEKVSEYGSDFCPKYGRNMGGEIWVSGSCHGSCQFEPREEYGRDARFAT